MLRRSTLIGATTARLLRNNGCFSYSVGRSSGGGVGYNLSFAVLQQSGTYGGFRRTDYRGFSSSTLTDDELRTRLNHFQDLFVEARYSIQDAQESLDTTYYEEDVAQAKKETDAAIAEYEDILSVLDEKTAGEFQRTNSMKIKQLQEELATVATYYKEDH